MLIDLSKRVIQQQGVDFGPENESSAYLFDISMLFEYFIRKLLKRSGLTLLSKSEKRHEMPAGRLNARKRRLEPDIVIKSNYGYYIFDVKYKTYNHQDGVKREDLFQLHTYTGQYANDGPIIGCGLIYPIHKDKLDKTGGMISDVLHQHKNQIPFYVVFLGIPNNHQDEFNNNMKVQCDAFIDYFKNEIIHSQK